jgi:hypothetical protein
LTLTSSEQFDVSAEFVPTAFFVSPTGDTRQVGGTLAIGLTVGLAVLFLIMALVGGIYAVFFWRRRAETAHDSVQVEADEAPRIVSCTAESDFDALTQSGLSEAFQGEDGFEESSMF